MVEELARRFEVSAQTIRKDLNDLCERRSLTRIHGGAIIASAALDEEGALLDFDYREVQVAQAIIANARSVMLVADSTKLRRSAPVRIAHISQIQTFVTDQELPERLATICHSKGIEVMAAMPKGAGDMDDVATDPPQDAAPEAAPVVRLR